MKEGIQKVSESGSSKERNSPLESQEATQPCVCVLSWVELFVTPWVTAGQAPLSMVFSSKITGLPFPPPGDRPNLGIKIPSAGGFLTTEPSGKPNTALLTP